MVTNQPTQHFSIHDIESQETIIGMGTKDNARLKKQPPWGEVLAYYHCQPVSMAMQFA